jgi:hypothetical protein
MYPDLFIFKGNTLKLERAPEPNDVLWNNLGVNKREKMALRVKTLMGTFMVLIMSFVVIICIYFL